MDAFTEATSDVATIGADEYRRSRRHQCAGPVSELVLSDTREKYAAAGATHWQLTCDRGATVLRPVTIDGGAS